MQKKMHEKKKKIPNLQTLNTKGQKAIKREWPVSRGVTGSGNIKKTIPAAKTIDITDA